MLIPVFPEEGLPPTHLAQMEGALRDFHRKVLAEAETKIRDDHPDLNVATRLEEGRPSAIIVDAAQEEDVDLIVIGSRGMGGITGWVLGSTSRGVVDACTKPVLVVK